MQQQIVRKLSPTLKTLKKINTGLAVSESEKQQKLPNALFIFRRDLRLVDNTALIACSLKYNVCPVFIFTPEQVNDNPFKSSNAIQFMIESLLELKSSIEEVGGRFHVFYGDNVEVLEQLINENDIRAIYVNKDYSPYSIKRDAKINDLAKKHNILFSTHNDLLLIDDVHAVKSNDGKYYYVYTHFFNRASTLKVRPVDHRQVEHWGELKENKFTIHDFKEFCLQKKFYEENSDLGVRGGRSRAFSQIENNQKELSKYKDLRNFPGFEKGTTRLSAHNKFGTVSIRELYWKFTELYGVGCELVKQLYWRDFYMYLGHHFPKIYDGHPIPSKQQYSNINWAESSEEMIKKWQEGKTGFPIVDAGMREMNTTGYMHNRVRMIVAMFLTKDMILDWRIGEKYFSNKLVDIDWAQNLGNWIWSAGTGPDGSPWLRIFNPHSQSLKVDPDCVYIKKWIPELKKIPAKDIHNWHKEWKNYKNVDYPAPILDHETQRNLAYKAYGVKSKASKGDD